MNISRNEVLKRKKSHKRLDSSKKLITKINAGLVLFSAGAVLCQLSNETTTIYAQSSRLSPSDFLKNVSDYARDIASKNDLYASVMIAQAALESGWGNSSLAKAPNYNLFGIKGSYNGNSVYVPTLEDDGSGNYYQINDSFRKYDNYGQSLGDYASVLTGDNDPSSWRYQYYAGARYSNASTYQQATAHLTGRYATDTSYASKLNQIIEQYGLTQYDMNGTPVVPSQPEKPVVSDGNNSAAPAPAGSYKVKAGDSMYRIAMNHGVTLDALMKANSMSSYFILPNQNLVIPGASTGGNQQEKPAPVEDEKEQTTPTMPSTPTTGGQYVVKAGDSYWAISKRYGVSVAELQRLNGTTSLLIHPGQTLKTPSATDGTVNTPAPTTPGNNGNTPVTPAPTTPSSGYTVKRGDSLYAIASKHGLTLAQLRQMNSLSGSLIHPGQQLVVTGSAPSVPAAPTVPNNTQPSTTPEATVPNTQTGSYTVKRGDSLYAIAQRNGITLAQLKSLNSLSGNLINPGQQLVVTGSAPMATASAVEAQSVAAPEVPVTEENSAVVESETPVAPSTETSAEGVEEVKATPAVHTIQAGETLYKVAQTYGVNVHDLIAQNGGSDVLVGQVIELNK